MKLLEQEKRLVISRLSVVASWSGTSAQTKRNSAVYTVPPGQAVLSLETVVHSSNNGSGSVSSLGEGLDLLTRSEFETVLDASIELAGNINDDDLGIKLEEKKRELMKAIDAYQTNKSVIKANVEASAHGSMFDRKRGWHEISVYADIINLGGASTDDLASAIEQEFNIDIPNMGS